MWETAIHKRFFKYWTIILLASTYIATRFLNIDYLIYDTTLGVYSNNLWLTIPTGFILIGALLIYRHELKRQAKLEFERQQRRWR